MKFNILVLIVILFPFFGRSQSISGPSNVQQNETHQYSFSNGFLIAGNSWEIIGGGEIQSTSNTGTTFEATIKWTSTGNKTLNFRNFSGILSQKNILVSSATVSLMPGDIGSDYSVCENSSLSIGSNPATGGTGSYTYSWEQQLPGGWQNVGAGQTYIPVNSGIFRRKVVSGSQTEYSNSINVIVELNTVAGNISGVSNSCGSGNETFSISGYLGTILRWQRRYKNGSGSWSSWTTITETDNATSVTTSLNEWSGGQRIYQVRAVVKNGSCSAKYPTKTVNVDRSSLAASLSGASEEFGVASGILTLGSGNIGSIIKWQYKNSSQNWVDISQTSSTLEYTNVQEPTYYRVVVKNSTCNAVTSNEVLINVLDVPSIDLGVSQNIRPGQQTILTASGGHTNYRWFKDEEEIQNENNSQLSVDEPGDYTLIVTSNGGASYTTGSAIIKTQLAPNSNSVITYIYREPIKKSEDKFNLDVSQQSIQAQIYDGLGRPSQQISLNSSPLGMDMVVPVEYDGLGRQTKSYLPYVDEELGMLKKSDAITLQAADYQNSHGTSISYSESRLETSALSRPLEQAAPGDAWKLGEATVKFDYQFNSAGEVKMWEYDGTTLNAVGIYNANELYKNSTTDEDGNQSITFTDKQGKTILKKSQVDDNQWAETYYVYDLYGQLVVVLPPAGKVASGDYTLTQAESSSSMTYEMSATVTIPAGITLTPGFEIRPFETYQDDFLKTWAFQYQYDKRGRMISKQVPGAERVDMVYDQWNRLVLTQDGNQRLNNEWLFTSYDALNRPVITGKLTKNQTQEQLQNHLNTIGSTNRFLAFTPAASNHEYNNGAYPFANASGAVVNEVLTVTYYDNYSWNNSELAYTNPAGLTQNTAVKGQVTGSMIKVADGSWITSATYYDDKYRPIQSQSTNHLGGKDIVTNYFDFIGQVDKTISSHSDGTNTTEITRTFDYDHAGRLLKTWHQIGSNAASKKLIASNEYSELGELKEKNLHYAGSHPEPVEGDFQQSVNYTYNIRGWLTSINDSDLNNGGSNDPADLFGMKLNYNSNPFGSGLYNGNISSMEWSDAIAGIGNERAYNYGYDGLNRLKTANHIVNNSNNDTAINDPFDVEIPEYDLNGNIKRLVRKGEAGANMDNLTYDYEGNRLLAVADSGNDEGFKDGNTSGDDYEYDENGNMTVDKNKGITNIEYNHLNLPIEVTMSGTGNYIQYLYDAAGIKLKQTVYEGGNPVKTTDYVGEFIYETLEGETEPKLQLIQQEEGRIIPKYSVSQPELIEGYDYQYHLKDHLGNVRVTFSTTHEFYNRTATFEDSNQATESLEFGNVTANRDYHPLVSNTGKAARLNNAAPAGPYVVLSVNKGDTVHLSAKGYYSGGSGYSNPIPSGTFETFLQDAVNTSQTLLEGGASVTSINNGITTAIAAIGVGGNTSNTVPGAYLNYLIFDREMNYQGIAGYTQISSAANGSEQLIERNDILIDREGYLIAYLSNESNTSNYVYFDDFTVYHGKTNIVSTDDYYPFGLTFNSYERTASVKNRFNTFQDQEYEEETGWVKFKWRNHQPEIGRFFNVDPLAEDYYYNSPYAFSENKVVAHIELEGLESYYAADGNLLGQVGTNTDVRVVNGGVTNQQAAGLIQGAGRSQDAQQQLMDQSVAYADYFTSVNDVTNDAPLETYANNGNNCNAACRQQLANEGVTPAGSDNSLHTKVATGSNLSANPIGGSILTQTQLNNGQPVMVGVQKTDSNGNSPNPGNTNSLTGHFVVIRSVSVSANGTITFNYLDNASTANGKSANNNFTLNTTNGQLIDNTITQTPWSDYQTYEVTEVREN